MANPTTGLYLNQTVPPASSGDQNAVIQTDGAIPEQSVTITPKRATSSLWGTVKTDNTTITIDGTGTISAVAVSSSVSVVEVALAPSSPGNFTVAHGLGVTPTGALIQMTSGGQVWYQSVTQFDSTNLYLVASDVGVTGKAVVFYAVSSSLAIAQVALTPSAPGNFTVAHGLGVIPTSAAVQMTSGGQMWFQTPTRFDTTNLYLVASDSAITGNAVLFH